jgi:hypothetical protein
VSRELGELELDVLAMVASTLDRAVLLLSRR